MTVDFNSPASIRAWLAAAPARHLPQLRALWRLQPQFREAIEAAVPAKPKNKGRAAPPVQHQAGLR
jgi:hypothetical protein